MPTRIVRTLIVFVGLLIVVGCGKSPPPAANQGGPGGGVIAVPAQAPAVGSAPVATGANSSKGKSKSSSTNAETKQKKSTIPANADPRTVFVMAGDGQPMEIQSTQGVLPGDQFQLVSADPRFDSTKFVVESIKSSSSTQTLIGPGEAKAGFALPKGFTAVKEVGYSLEGLPLRIRCEKTGSMLALVSAGNSIVGTDVGPAECKPSFTVRLSTFYMEILEVTVSNYENFRTEMKEEKEKDKKKSLPPTLGNPSAGANMPALGVTFAGALSYAHWAGMELPTEAEWEKAARGPNGFRTPWGEGKPLWTTRSLGIIGAYPTDSSPYGIMDMAGNAKEWCADLYSSTAHVEASTTTAKDALLNWPGPKRVRDMNLRVVKGSSPDDSSWHREGKDMSRPHLDVGFRCVLRIPHESKSATTAKPAI